MPVSPAACLANAAAVTDAVPAVAALAAAADPAPAPLRARSAAAAAARAALPSRIRCALACIRAVTVRRLALADCER